MNFVKRLVEEWGNTVVGARTIIACCAVPIMKDAERSLLRSSRADALVVISCAAGVKSAFLCEPGVPIVAACDTVGAANVENPDSPADAFVEHTLCTSCGHCVISYTGGICPLASCPAKSLYGPCNKATEEGTECALDSGRECVWKEIESRGADLTAVQDLKRLHERNRQNRIPSLKGKSSKPFLRKCVGIIGSRIPGRFMETAHWAR